MAYPLDDSFENAPSPGYYQTAENAVVSYNALDQCLEVSGTSGFSWVKFIQPGSGDLWFEADLELVEDNKPHNPQNPYDYKYFGIHLSSSGNFYEGVRFGFYQDHRFMGYYNSGNGHTDIQLGYTSYGGAALGRRYTVGLRILENPDIAGVRSIQSFVDDVLAYELHGSPNWSTPSKLWVPQVFRYNCDIRIHAIRGGIGSGLTGWPVSVGVSGHSLRPFRIPQNDRLNDTGEEVKYGNRRVSLRPKRQAVYFHGKGSIVGTLKKAATPQDLPMSRRIYLIEEDSNIVVDEVWSDQNGNYRFDSIDENLHWTVVAYDHEQHFRSVIANNLKAVRL